MKPLATHLSRLRCTVRACLALALASLAALAGMPALAKTEHYSLDPVHTRIAFQISHAGFSNPVGTFAGSTGSLDFDEHDWSSAMLDVRIPIASLNLGDSNWQKKILDRTFFDAGKFPQAHFRSTGIESTGPKTARVTGELTLHGVTRPVTLDATLNALGRHPLTLRKTIGFSATARLSRKDFGMDAWKSLVGDEVRLIIEVEAERAHANDTPDPERPAPAGEDAVDANAQ